jgi:Terminase large subunit, T4likevirus-type, N-terminal
MSLRSRLLAMRYDPAELARACGIEPDDWQAVMLRSLALRLIANCHRQSGKSTIAALIALHVALFQAASLTLLLSPTLRQSGELFKKVQWAYNRLGRPIRATAETALTLTLEQGSRVVSLPGEGDTVRGYSAPDLVILDEASRVNPAMLAAIRPMLAVSGGRLLFLSTPDGMDPVFWEAWQSEEEDWERYQITAPECPRISPSFLAQERRTLPEAVFAQEYLCEFRLSSGALFREEDINRAFSADLEEWIFPGINEGAIV